MSDLIVAPADSLSIIAGVFFVIGALLTLLAGIGLVRLQGLLARMHAGTKPQLMGLIFMCIGLAIELRSWRIALILGLVLFLQMVSVPVGSHLLARAGYRTGHITEDVLEADELTADLRIAQEQMQEEHNLHIAQDAKNSQNS
ncbi:MAG: monovalent cation/H(+) antiporter subunit G [Actinomycetaceae bacterium]|nr:monovalent cation/H(+) antiporter subunit G [Actinomycetaceae bacterium]